MKNLKKVLALVLVFASLLGLATMASATKSDDYSDAASISHIEAVDVMSTIGVFDGISGAFSGDSILTREQAAKIITYMILGKDDADSLVASVAPYTDVARDRWSAGSIAYCKNAGILAGVGNGRFEPNGKLTGIAFAKMCLVALGYDPNVEGLTGSDWAVNTSKLAIAGAKITGSLSQASLADDMSREDACQMAFNTLQANMVDYESRGSSIVINDITINTGSSKAKPVAQETNWAGVATKKGYDGAVDGIQQFTEQYFSKLRKSTGTDSFGRPSNIWTYKSEDIGTYIRNNLLVEEWTAKVSQKDMYNAIGSAVYNRLKDGDTNLVSHVDGTYATGADTVAVADLGSYFNKSSSKSVGIPAAGVTGKGDLNKESGNGVKTELYMDDEGNVWIAMINTYLVKANADYNSVKESVSVEAVAFDDTSATGDTKLNEYTAVGTAFLPNEISNDDFDVTGVKEGDYLLLNVNNIDLTKNSCDVKEITYATVQKGTVTEYTEETDVVMGGTTYKYNKILKASQKKTQFAINSEATLVLDAYGYIMCVDDSVDSSSYVYIDQFGYKSGLGTKAIADAYFTDGTNAEIDVSKVDNDSKAGVIYYKPAGWYTFSGTAGGPYTLTSLSADYTQPGGPGWTIYGDGKTLVKSGTVKFLSESAYSSNPVFGVKGDDKTVFIIKNTDGDVSAYTGISKVPTVKLSSNSSNYATITWAAKGDYAKYVFVDVSNDPGADVDEGTSAADYMYVLKTTNNTTHVDGLEYQKYTVVIDGKVEDRWVVKNAVAQHRFYYSVKEDDKGRIKGAKEVGQEGSKANKTMFMAAMGKLDANTYFAKSADNGYDLTVDTVITRSGSTLSIPALKDAYNVKSDGTQYDKSDLITTEKSNINVVIGKDCELLKDNDSSYETYLGISASQFAGLLSGKSLHGRVYLVTTEDDGDVIDTLWVYVAKAPDAP